MPTTDPVQLLDTHVRWRLVAFFVGLGALFIVGGAFVSADAFRWGDAPSAYWSGVAGNIGCALLLAALLVWFERRFTGRVDRVARAVAVQTAAEMVEEMMDELAEDTASARKARAAAAAAGAREANGSEAGDRELRGRNPGTAP